LHFQAEAHPARPKNLGRFARKLGHNNQLHSCKVEPKIGPIHSNF